MMKKEKVILSSDPNLAEYRTDIKGWVGKDGKYYGEDKRIAIYANCTHHKCKEGHVYSRSYISCPTCKEMELPRNYMRLKFKEWDKNTPLALFNDEIFFWSVNDVYDYSNDNHIAIHALDLVICEPQHLQNIEGDFWLDIIPEDSNLEDVTSEEFTNKLKELNDIINNHKPVSWIHGNFRTTIKL